MKLLAALTLLAATATAGASRRSVKIIPGAVPVDRPPDGNTVIFEDETGPAVTRSDFDQYPTAFGQLIDCAASTGSATSCAGGWHIDAARFMADARERDYAARAIDYYLTNILRVPAKQTELCPT